MPSSPWDCRDSSAQAKPSCSTFGIRATPGGAKSAKADDAGGRLDLADVRRHATDLRS